jgi:protein SCO1/2
MVAALVLVAVAEAVSLLSRWRRPAPPPRMARVPELALINRDGRTVRRGDLLGKPWVADFVFTHCAGSCPLLSARMARLDRELPPGAARLVSVSVDPEHDTRQVLARYAASFGASQRWLFLTGDRDQILRLSRDGFRLAVGGGGPTREPILHSTRFVLVDREGWIRRYYDALDPAALAQLPGDLAALGD